MPALPRSSSREPKVKVLDQILKFTSELPEGTATMTYGEFWVHYLRAHQRTGTRTLHYEVVPEIWTGG
jgi:hypothetical protein